MNNLSENSKSYYAENDVYKFFSEAEDYPDLAWKEIAPLFVNKTVLDLGCGNGKYLKKIAGVTRNYYGLDKSQNQISLIDELFRHKCVVSDAQELPFADNQFDFVLSCWMLGTVVDKKKQEKILIEAKRVLKSGGKLIFIENDCDGEFEVIRGRDSKKDTRTQDYNNFLLSNGFTVKSQIKSYFKFQNIETARNVLYKIWNNRLTKKISSASLEHNIVIFSFEK